MRGIKPMHVTFLSRPFEYERRFFLNVAALIGFRFDGSVRLMSEMAIWGLIAEELGKEAVIDECLPKSRAEFLVRGRVYCPGGQPQTTCPVKVKVGSVEKTLYVIGDRYWKDGVPSAPEPFTSMDLTWTRAYGGEGYERNPLGKGFAQLQDDAGKAYHPLPNIETPARMIESPRDKREPAGLLPYPVDWPQRRERLGTYDDKWLKEDFPGYPRDIDWSAFNVATADQQQEAPWVGDETFVLTNMHPDKPELTGRMPRIQPRCFLTFKGADDPAALTDVPLRATTLWLFPHIETGILVFHGAQRVNEDDAHDVESIMLAAENLGEPRPIEHYQRIRASTEAHEADGVIALVSGTGLVPDGCDGVAELKAEVDALKPKGLIAAAGSRRAQSEHEQARAELEARGMDPGLIGPAPEPLPEEPPGIAELAALMQRAEEDMEEQRKEAEERRLKIEQEVKAFCEENDLDYDAVFVETAGPPRFSAEEQIGKIEASLANSRMLGCPVPELEAQVGDPAFRQQLHDQEAQLHEAYRLSAHSNEKVPPARDEEEEAVRKALLLDLMRSETGTAAKDFTGIDLSGEDLSGANLAGIFMECANLSGANLTGADLTGAVLSNADLTKANLTGAKLNRANLGRANLSGASAEAPPELRDAILEQINLTGAQLPGIELKDAILRESSLDGANLAGARIEQCIFLKCTLRGTDFSRASLPRTSLIDLDATGIIATEAFLEALSMHDVKADGSKFDRARMNNFRATGKTSLARSDFSCSQLVKSCFRAIDLTESVFAGADVSKSDLAEAICRNGNLEGLIAIEALMTRINVTEANLSRANLMNAILSKADLTGANLENANLFGADLSRARSDGGTQLAGAIQTRARIHPTQPPKVNT